MVNRKIEVLLKEKEFSWGGSGGEQVRIPENRDQVGEGDEERMSSVTFPRIEEQVYIMTEPTQYPGQWIIPRQSYLRTQMIQV